MSNQDPQWTGKNEWRAHTNERGRKRLHARPPDCSRAQMHGIVRRWELVVHRHERFACRRIGSCANGNRSRANGNVLPADGNVSCADGNISRVDENGSCANGSRKSENFGKPSHSKLVQIRNLSYFLASTRNVDAKKHLKRPIRISFE